MTTNVFDQNTGTIATDSRWSIQYGRLLLYVDDVPYHKIELANDTAFMFAGKGIAIQNWKNWIRSNPESDAAMPELDGLSVCVIEMPTNAIRFVKGEDIARRGAIFAGSGSRHAFMCWQQHRNAKKAVETAKEFDVYSGGEVRFVETHSRANNLAIPIGYTDPTIESVTQAIATRGSVMELTRQGNGSPPFNVADAACDTSLAEVQGKILRGELQPEAPCDSMHNEWSDDEKRGFRAVLAEVFKWR